MMEPKIYPICESAIAVDWGNQLEEAIFQQVQQLNTLLSQNPFIGFTETVPAYSTLTVYFRPELIISNPFTPVDFITTHIKQLLLKVANKKISSGKMVSIPVCYDDAFGVDLDYISKAKGIAKRDVIQIHQQKEYTVYMMGFLPGFAYMGEVEDSIATARKPTPINLVEEGSVGIAGKQTGIYPLPSPGGWQIIGRTPLCLFDLQKTNPFLLNPGDSVRFYEISLATYYLIKKDRPPFHFINSEQDNDDALVLKPGVLSSIQDEGRVGYRAYGVPESGAMDLVSHCIANALVGNTRNAATIECTLGGLRLKFNATTVIAIAGGGSAFINGQAIKYYQPLLVLKNDVLEIIYNQNGTRTYIAVRGGVGATEVMKSKSVCPLAGIGAPLQKEGRLTFEKLFTLPSKTITATMPIPNYPTSTVVRVMPGAEKFRMTTESIQRFYSQPFTLSPRFDRMGYHLQGLELQLKDDSELLSTAVNKGTIQLTPNGKIIILMNDCQTTGGYPRIAQVAAVDLSLIAQLKPGDTIRFVDISFQEATELYLLQENNINAFFD
jgi:KipI family sensor histidine kinase inhibitor